MTGIGQRQREASPPRVNTTSLLRHLTEMSDPATLARYFIAGVVVSLGYTLTVVIMIEWLGWHDPVTANAVSLCLWTPLSYIAHRDFTFRFDGASGASALKFALTFTAKLLVSALVVSLATEILGIHYIFGVLANWIAIPLATYLILKLWVFR